MLSLAFLFISWQWMQTFRALTEKIIVKRTEGGSCEIAKYLSAMERVSYIMEESGDELRINVYTL